MDEKARPPHPSDSPDWEAGTNLRRLRSTEAGKSLDIEAEFTHTVFLTHLELASQPECVCDFKTSADIKSVGR